MLEISDVINRKVNFSVAKMTDTILQTFIACITSH
jgi:hypothetical protein